MARFDYYRRAPAGGGWLLDVQADALDLLNTRIVAPLLLRSGVPEPTRRLNPVFRIGEEDFVLATQLLTAVPLSALKERGGSLAGHRDQITMALDMLFLGF